MIRELSIKSNESILELGRLNLFIGENGCGKTNILKATAIAAAAVSNRLDTEELYVRDAYVAKAGHYPQRSTRNGRSGGGRRSYDVYSELGRQERAKPQRQDLPE